MFVFLFFVCFRVRIELKFKKNLKEKKNQIRNNKMNFFPPKLLVYMFSCYFVFDVIIRQRCWKHYFLRITEYVHIAHHTRIFNLGERWGRRRETLCHKKIASRGRSSTAQKIINKITTA
jgi:hypothetical protein